MRALLIGAVAAATLFTTAAVRAAPIAAGTKIGVDLGPTSTTNWNNFTANGTIGAGSVVGLNTAAVVDGVSITVSDGQFFNTDGTDNWAGLASNGGTAPADFVDSVTTDIAGNFSLGDGTPFRVTLNGLDPSLLYNVTAVTAGPGTQIDTVTVVGATTSAPSPIVRTAAAAGAFHSFSSLQPTAGGQLDIRMTDTSDNTNPILSGVLVTAVPEPGTFGLFGAGGLLLLRRRRG